MPRLAALATALLAVTTLPAQWWPYGGPVAPSPRFAVAMAADHAGSTILFGGRTDLFMPSANGETWRFDGSVWQQLAPLAPPSGRHAAAMVFDSVRNVFVLHGGLLFIALSGTNQTWEFDGASWTQITTPTPGPAVAGHVACFDSARGRVVVYGGATGNPALATSDTYEYDGTNWQLASAAGAPGPLSGPAMCFAANVGRAVLFGGYDPATVQAVDTTWLYDGITWQAAPVAGLRPQPRIHASMAYDAARGVCVLVGGYSTITGAPLTDTWEFDGNGWQEWPSAFFNGTELAGLAYDVGHENLVRFGGLGSLSGWPDGATWLYGAFTTTYGQGCAGSNGVPLLQSTTIPMLGFTWHLQLSNLVPTVPFAVVVLGLTNQPGISLAPIGMPGCSAFVSPDLFVALPAAGQAQFATHVPANPGLFLAHVFAQGLSLDAAANPAGLTVSNAVQAVLGH